MSEVGGTQRDIGALEASVDNLRSEFDTRVTSLETSFGTRLAAIERAIERTAERAQVPWIAILGLVMLVVTASAAVLNEMESLRDDRVRLRIEGVEEVAAVRDAALQFSILENRGWIGSMAREDDVFTAELGRLTAFRDSQNYRNEREDRNTDAMATATALDKDAFERDALTVLREQFTLFQAEVRESLKELRAASDLRDARIEEGVRNGFLTNKERAGGER